MKSCTIHVRASVSTVDVSEARTVLSRAASALRTVEADIDRDGETRRDYVRDYRKPPVDYKYETDPDVDRIRLRLMGVVAELDHWRKCYSDCEGRA